MDATKENSILFSGQREEVENRPSADWSLEPVLSSGKLVMACNCQEITLNPGLPEIAGRILFPADCVVFTAAILILHPRLSWYHLCIPSDYKLLTLLVAFIYKLSCNKQLKQGWREPKQQKSFWLESSLESSQTQLCLKGLYYYAEGSK